MILLQERSVKSPDITVHQNDASAAEMAEFTGQLEALSYGVKLRATRDSLAEKRSNIRRVYQDRGIIPEGRHILTAQAADLAVSRLTELISIEDDDAVRNNLVDNIERLNGIPSAVPGIDYIHLSHNRLLADEHFAPTVEAVESAYAPSSRVARLAYQAGVDLTAKYCELTDQAALRDAPFEQAQLHTALGYVDDSGFNTVAVVFNDEYYPPELQQPAN